MISLHVLNAGFTLGTANMHLSGLCSTEWNFAVHSDVKSSRYARPASTVMTTPSSADGDMNRVMRDPAREPRGLALFAFSDTALTNLIDHFERNVELQDDQDVLEPGAHLLVGERHVHSENNVIGIQCFCQGLVKTVDLLAPV